MAINFLNITETLVEARINDNTVGSNLPTPRLAFKENGVVSGGISTTGGNLILETSSGTERVRITTTGNAVFAGDISLADGKKLQLGAANDLQIYHDGTNSFISNGTGDITIENSQNDGDIFFKSDDGSGGLATYLQLDGGTAITKAHKIIRFLDGVKSTFGNTDDLQIYHNGSNSFIQDVGTGFLAIDTNGTDVRITKSDSEYIAKFITDGAVELYYDSAKKFETTSTGVTVTGVAKIQYNGVGLDVENTASNGADTGIRIRGARNGQSFASGNLTSYALFSNYDDNTTPNNYDLAKIGAGMYDANADTGYFRIMTNNGTAMTKALDIDKSQNALFYANVGIGTTSPTNKLTISDNSAQIALIDTSTSNKGEIQVGDADFTFNLDRDAAISSGKFAWRIDDTTRMELGLDSGDLGQLRLNEYGSGNITGTATFLLGVDENGYIIEENTSGGGTVTGSGAATRVAFWSGTSALSSDANLYWDNSNDRLGIGTTSPSAKLHVDQPTTSANSLTYGAAAGQIFTNENSEFAFGLLNASPYPLYIQGRRNTNQERDISFQGLGGNIGIGTYSPTKKLTVKVGSANDDGIVIQDENGNTRTDLGLAGTAGAREGRIKLIDDAGNTNVQIHSDTTSYFNGGNVGIGTTSPDSPLHIYQNGGDTSTAAGITIEQDGTGDAVVQYLLTGNRRWVAGVDNSDSDRFKFSSSADLNSDTVLTINTHNAGGYVGIGLTSPAHKLDVNHGASTGAGITTVARFSAGTGSASGDGTQINLMNWNDNYGGFIRTVNTGGTPSYLNPRLEFGLNYQNYLPADMATKMVILGTGNVGIGTTSPSAKINIANSTNQNGGTIENSSASFDQTGLLVNNTSSTSGELFRLRSSGSNKFIVSGSGDATFAGNIEVNAAEVNIDSATHATLTLDRASTSYDNNIMFKTAADTKFRIWQDGDSDYLYIRDDDNATNMVTFKKGGNVGIGTTAPTEKLHVEGRIRLGTTPVICSHDNIGIDIDQNNNSSSNYFRVTRDGEVTELFRVQENGNVGIGTSSPATELDIAKDIDAKLRITSTRNGSFVDGDNFGSLEFYGKDTSGLGEGIRAAIRAKAQGTYGIDTNLTFSTSNGSTGLDQERMRINSAGAIKFNNYDSTNNTGTPTYLLGTDGSGNIVKTLSTPGGIPTQHNLKSKAYTSLVGSPSSGSWFDIFTITDSMGPVNCKIFTYAHDALEFSVAEGYGPSNAGTITVINSVNTSNSGYATVSEVRIDQNGVVSIKLVWSSGPTVNIGISISGYNVPNLTSTLSVNTSTVTVVDSVNVDVTGIVRSRKQLRAGSNVLFDTSGNSYINGGNIGIGNTSPSFLLDLASLDEADPTDFIRFGANNGNSAGTSDDLGTGIVWKPNYTGYTKRSAGIVQIGEGNYFRSGLGFFTNATANATTDWSERMRISMDGKVGIGTTDPDAPLTVHSSTDPEIRFGYSSSQDHKIQWDSSKVFIHADPENANASSAIALYVDGGAKLYIPDSGNVGIGTTSPSSKLTVVSNSNTLSFNEHGSSAIAELKIIGDTAHDTAIYFGDATDNVRAGFYYDVSSNQLQVRGYNNGTRMVVNSNGNVGIGTTSPSAKLHVNGTAKATKLELDESSSSTGDVSSPAGFIDVIVGGTGYIIPYFSPE